MKKVITAFLSLVIVLSSFINLVSVGEAAMKTTTLLSPIPGSTLTGANVTLKWKNIRALSYDVAIGSAQALPDYGWFGGLKRNSVTINNLPTNGSTIHIRIFSNFASGSYAKDFTLKAFTAVNDTSVSSPTPSPTPTLTTGTLSAVWANEGGDKVSKDELRASVSPASVANSVWDGSTIKLFGAKNEIVSFNLILESAKTEAKNVSVQFQALNGPNGSTIQSTPTTGNGIFDWTKRDIELFFVRYLPIKGLSRLSYETYDERHIPKRFQRPFSGEGIGVGTWNDRPDHDKKYPEIAVPLELHPVFTIPQSENQSIWSDVYIPKTTPAGIYSGTVTVFENAIATKQIPVQLTVRDFELPDVPHSKTMVFMSRENVNKRFFGNPWLNEGTADALSAKKIRDTFFQIAHRHKISLIDADTTTNDAPSSEWLPRLNGSLFQNQSGYRGPGEGTGNGVYSIGTYGTWDWQQEGEGGMRMHADAWTNWFNAYAPSTEFFLYLIDESDNYPLIQTWASWLKNNPGPGKALRSFATIPLTAAVSFVSNLQIPASWFTVGDTTSWQQAHDQQKSEGKKFFLYNGKRPSQGSFATEDDGVALRQLPWAQYKKGIDRWFFWESTYYNNYQGGQGETNVFQKAQTFGSFSGTDAILGQTGWNYSNGDGVLFYPGTDKIFPGDSYDVLGPFVSLRLKTWRRGIQDVDYLALAHEKDPVKTKALVQKMVPKAFWEYGVSDAADPTWVRSDISWSIHPNDWESARAQLADIIQPVF